jgi:threonine dehydratase
LAQGCHPCQIVHIDTPKTIADGAQTQHLGAHRFPLFQHYVDDVVTVSDAQLVEMMAFFASRMKTLVEPTGCLGAAAVFHNIVAVQGKKVGIILSGGNIDLGRSIGAAEFVQRLLAAVMNKFW